MTNSRKWWLVNQRTRIRLKTLKRGNLGQEQKDTKRRKMRNLWKWYEFWQLFSAWSDWPRREDVSEWNQSVCMTPCVYCQLQLQRFRFTAAKLSSFVHCARLPLPGPLLLRSMKCDRVKPQRQFLFVTRRWQPDASEGDVQPSCIRRRHCGGMLVSCAATKRLAIDRNNDEAYQLHR